MVEDRIDGSMLISYKDTILKFKEIIIRPEKVVDKNLTTTTAGLAPRREEIPKLHILKLKRIYIPPADHPWRKFKINSKFKPYEQKEKSSPKEEKLLLTKT